MHAAVAPRDAIIPQPDGSIRLRNLAARADPWVVLGPQRGAVRRVDTAAVTVLWVEGMLVSEQDTPAALLALAAAPEEGDRHDELADSQRFEAGKAAMQIEDAMVRARLLDYVDGWSAIAGPLIEETPEGKLSETKDAEADANLLELDCPSTERHYALLVPTELRTVATARKWVNCGLEPEAES